MDSLSVYRELADRYDRLGQVSMRDRFLILAADSALEAGQVGAAERLRLRLLQGSRNHMLLPYNSFAEAVRAADVQSYLHDLRRNYPFDVAKQLLESVQANPGKPMAALDHTEPMSWNSPEQPTEQQERRIPPTMPLLDITGAIPAGNNSDDRRETLPLPKNRQPEQSETYPLREEQPTAATRPLAQPVPGRPNAAQSNANTRSAPLPATIPPAGRPKVGRAIPQPAPPRLGDASPPATRKLEATYPLAAPSDMGIEREEESPYRAGAWLSMLLVGVVGMAGIALVASTLARPFLPPEWLP